MKVIGYLRVSTDDQNYGVEVQRQTIVAEASRRGWEVDFVEDKGRTGKNAQRPGLQYALASLAEGHHGALVVHKIDRLSRSLGDFAGILQRSQREGWALVALDLNVDTSTPVGGLLVGVMAAVAEWEGRMISERTRASLAQAKAAGKKLGAPVSIPDAVAARILAERAAGKSKSRIARDLNRDGVLPPRGQEFYASTVTSVLNRLSQAA